MSDARAVSAQTRFLANFWLAAGIGSLLVIAALLFVPAFAPWLMRFEHGTADWRTAFLSDQATTPHPRIAVVTITDATLRDYVSSPMDRGLLARIVRAVDNAGAKAIGLDVFFLKKTDADKDQALMDALRSAKAAVVLGAVDERGELESYQREFQARFLTDIGRPIGYLNLRRERDDVVRYTAAPFAGSQFPKSFAALLAEAGGAPASYEDSRPIAWLRGPNDSAPPFVVIPAHDLIADPDLGTPLKGKLVLIGADRPRIDRHRTPLSVRDGNEIAGVFIHAETLAMLMDPTRAVSELDPTTTRILILFVALIGFGLGWRFGLTNVVGVLSGTTATVGLVAIDAFVFREIRLILPFTLAAVSWVAGLTAGRAMRSSLTGPHTERRSAT